MRNKLFIGIFTLLAQIAFTAEASAQASAQVSPTRLMIKADSCRMAYNFAEAVQYSESAVEALDSTASARAEEQLLMARNGLNMMSFCSQPTVVAKQTFPLKDFFLFYPLKDHSWRKTPNQLDSLGGDNLSRAIFIPDGSRDIYYSAKDEEGIRNIYATHLTDSLWSVPTLINEQMTSSSDEIYPMLSPDGQSLYFASKGLYGMGGYDLYVSNWNSETNDWDMPVNMGFPYSSPYDDFLFVNTEDGKYSIFASNRECGRDSVTIYVLEYDSMPVRKAVTDVDELRALASLNPARDHSRIDNDAAVPDEGQQNESTKRYMDKMREVRALRDSVARFGKNLEKMRSGLAGASGEEKARLTAEISDKEMMLPTLNSALNAAVKELQNIEMDFLANGIVIDTRKLQAEADKEIVGASSGYTFSKNSYGPALHLDIMKPKPTFDYSFMILPEGRFAENNTLPEGIIYQIRIFTLGRKATVADLNGLSPVFERTTTSGRHAYSVGLFKSYKDVLSNLNKVKNRGFRDAQIDAFHNGQVINVRKARELESKVRTLFMVKIFPEDGQSLSEQAIAAVHEHSDKDLIKSVEAGSVVFTTGPFEDKSQVDVLVAALKAAGAENVSVSESTSE
mgnify:FL=1